MSGSTHTDAGEQTFPGYRHLTDEEIGLISEIKRSGDGLGAALDSIAKLPNVDQRWLAIARTQMQLGQMALVRAVARPDGF